jgi:hypothetical protein
LPSKITVQSGAKRRPKDASVASALDGYLYARENAQLEEDGPAGWHNGPDDAEIAVRIEHARRRQLAVEDELRRRR